MYEHSDLDLQATQVLPGDQQEKKKGGKGKGRAASSGKVRHTHTSSLSLTASLSPLPPLCLLQTTVRKEIQLIPNLIYSMEQFETFLIQLTKKSKVCV